jgi:hypothetical protein
VSTAATDSPDGDAGESAAEDDIIKTANPTKYAENGLQYWQALAAQTVKTYVKLAVEPSTEGGLAALLEGSEANKVRGTEARTSVLLLLDPDLLAEASTRPADRKAVLPDGFLARLLRGSMQGRGCQKNKDDEYMMPLPSDVFLLLDGKREYLHKLLLDAFTPKGRKSGTDATVKAFTLFASETSLRARKTLIRGCESLSQKQTMFCVTATTLVPDTIPEKFHTKYSGSNRGDIIGPITLTTTDQQWQLPFGKKKTVYGDRLLAGDSTDKDTRSIRLDDSLEPVFYHHLPATFYEDAFVVFSATAVIDLSTGPGEAAKAALLTRKPYLGLCLTESHLVKLYRHLTHWTLTQMGTEGSALYNPKYVESTTSTEKPKVEHKPKVEPKPQAEPKNPKKPKKEPATDDTDNEDGQPAKKKAKTKKAATAVSSSDPDSA